MKWLLKILSLIAIKYLIWLKNWEKNSNEWNWQLTVLFSKWVFTFDLMLWLQSLLSLWNQGLSPLKSLVAKSIYLFLEFKNWGNIFFPLKQCNILFIICLNLLSEYWFCKIYSKKLVSQIQFFSNCAQPGWAEETSPFARLYSSWIDFIIIPPVVSKVHHRFSLLAGRK